MTATVEHLQSGTKLPTHTSIGVHINADTELECRKVQRGDGSEYFAAEFRSPGQLMGLSLYLDEAEMLRLWFVFESARRSEADAQDAS